MTEATTQRLGQLIRQRREQRGWSTVELAERTGITQSNIVRMEQGNITSPGPERLARVADALAIPLADLYSLAGYPLTTELPSLPTYLRTKYRELPAPAQEELAAYVARLREKYGLTADGPAPGEDEQDEP